MAMASDEIKIREAAESCLLAWATEIEKRDLTNIHDDCSVMDLSGSGDSYTTTAGKLYTMPDSVQPESIAVELVRQLLVGSKSAASVHARVGTNRSIWMVFLLTDGVWKCISAAAATEGALTLPSDFASINACVWDGYCRANRACDGGAMAQYFHPTCRLTYVGPDGTVAVKDAATFCGMVQNRYTMPMHESYAHLKEDPRVGSKDALLSIDFGSLSAPVAMVVLKVAHPPFLWTDVLTVACLKGKWWIVHKSSCSEPFLADEKK